MKKWLKINGSLINLNHVMLINKCQKFIDCKDYYYIEFTFINDLVVIPSEGYQKNIMRISCKNEEDMNQTYNSIINFMKGDLTYYERNS